MCGPSALADNHARNQGRSASENTWAAPEISTAVPDSIVQPRGEVDSSLVRDSQGTRMV